MYLVLHVGVALLLRIDSNPGVFQTWKQGKSMGKDRLQRVA